MIEAEVILKMKRHNARVQNNIRRRNERIEVTRRLNRIEYVPGAPINLFDEFIKVVKEVYRLITRKETRNEKITEYPGREAGH